MIPSPNKLYSVFCILYPVVANCTAIPSLDLVLTPNGFGIVNTTTIVPASKERIERLQLSIESLRDTVIEQLLHRLAPIVDSYKYIPNVITT